MSTKNSRQQQLQDDPGRRERVVALLRGINVGGNKKVPMAALRTLAGQLGWCDVATHVQSGNLVGTVGGSAPAIAAELEHAIGRTFGFPVPVIVRTGDEFVRNVGDCPFEDGKPEQVHIGYGQSPLPPTLARDVAAYCKAGERVVVRGNTLWIDFAGGVARSKLTSAVLDRAVGGAVTLRNLRSARAITGLLAGKAI